MELDDAREPSRVFVPARRDVADLSALADLEKVTVVSYNVLSQMGARRLQRIGGGSGSYVESSILTIAGRREKLLRYVCVHARSYTDGCDRIAANVDQTTPTHTFMVMLV